MPMHSVTFKVGDRVRLNEDYYATKGEEGYVFGYSIPTLSPFVVFDRIQGHDGNTSLDRPNPNRVIGWYINNGMLELVNLFSDIPEPLDEDLV